MRRAEEAISAVGGDVIAVRWSPLDVHRKRSRRPGQGATVQSMHGQRPRRGTRPGPAGRLTKKPDAGSLPGGRSGDGALDGLRSVSRITVPSSLHLDLRPLDHHLPGVRVANRRQVADLAEPCRRSKPWYWRVVELAVLRGRVVKDLEFAHADVGGPPRPGSGSPGRCCRRAEVELEAGCEVGHFLVVIDRAPLFGLCTSGRRPSPGTG